MVKRIEHVIENNIEKKWCGKCKQFNPLDNYGKSKQTWDKLRGTCKECLKKENLKNKEKRRQYNKEYWEKTKAQQQTKNKIWRENNKEYIKKKNKEYRLKNGKEYDKKQWQKRKNDEEYKEKNREYKKLWCREQRKNNHQYKIQYNISRRIRELLNNDNASLKTLSSSKYIGCSTLQLQCHLEKKFQDGMTWNNYGRMWHIDHIIPCSSFNLKRDIEKMACFYYKNLQPMWATENIKKSNNYCETDKNKYIATFKEVVFM
jgi:hypothetical protein